MANGYFVKFVLQDSEVIIVNSDYVISIFDGDAEGTCEVHTTKGVHIVAQDFEKLVSKVEESGEI